MLRLLNSKSHKNVLQLVLRSYFFIALAFSGAFSNLAMASAMASQSALAAADIMMLCTGKGMRFVSLSQFVELGLVVDVSPPTQTDLANENTAISCPCSHVADLKVSLDDFAPTIAPIFKKYAALTFALPSQAPRLIAFVVPLSRAPPHQI